MSQQRSPIPAKGVVIGENHPREDPSRSPNKKGKATSSPKEKEVTTTLEAKKIGKVADVLKSHTFLETWGRNLGKTWYCLGTRYLYSWQSLHHQEDTTGSDPTCWQKEGICARILPGCLEQGSMKRGIPLARASSFLKKQVVELREALAQTKDSVVEEFKSSSDFLGAVEDVASKYFGEGFDFYKWHLCRHHPDLAIDLENMGLDHGLLAEEDEVGEEEEEERKNEENSGKDKGDTNPPPS
ncbi:hypothetical protein Acr_00g0017710 [Actinidia rufa]|uniref:Uncharacterized protein n=1 Tax=Actinidia rufa TaxID=165716 RepID=A0A7J0DBA1_9ERIC|nr:hypothetical protein Acr_00g0017710 [Actinidia rufa]